MQNGQSHEYPIELNMLTGQEISIKIKGLRKKNIEKLIKCYKVLCVSNEKTVIQSWKNLLSEV